MTTDEYLAVITICCLIITVIKISQWLYSFISEK